MNSEMVESIVMSIVVVTMLPVVVLSILRWSRRRKRAALAPVAELMNMSLLNLPKNLYGGTASGMVGGRPLAIYRTWDIVVPSAMQLPDGAVLAFLHRGFRHGVSNYDANNFSGTDPAQYGEELPLGDRSFAGMYAMRSKHPQLAQRISSHPAVVTAIVQQRIPMCSLVFSYENEVVTLKSGIAKGTLEMRQFSSPADVKLYAERLVLIMQAVEQALGFDGDWAAAALRFIPHKYGYPFWAKN